MGRTAENEHRRACELDDNARRLAARKSRGGATFTSGTEGLEEGTTTDTSRGKGRNREILTVDGTGSPTATPRNMRHVNNDALAMLTSGVQGLEEGTTTHVSVDKRKEPRKMKRRRANEFDDNPGRHAACKIRTGS
jgi:hypothetical protein